MLYLVVFFLLILCGYNSYRIADLTRKADESMSEMEAQEKMNEVFMANDASFGSVLENHKDAIAGLYVRMGGRIIEVKNYSEMTH